MDTPAYPDRYVHSVQQFTQNATREQRVFVFQHLVKPLKQAFPMLDDVSAGTLACQLYSGLSLDPRRLAGALAMANGFLLDTSRIEPAHAAQSTQKLAGVLQVFIPLWLARWPAVMPTLH